MTRAPSDLPDQDLGIPDAADVPLLIDDPLARQLRGFGLLGIVAALVILAGNLVFLPLSAILVLVWTTRSRTPWRDIGFTPEPKWHRTVISGVVFGIAFKLLMKSIVMPLLGAEPINHAYHYLAGNRAALPYALYTMIIGAGFGEETVFRGYLFERLGKLFGTNRPARISTIVLTSILFGVAHYSVQGPAGAEQATITGLVFGAIFAATGRIWFPMISHAAFDVTALAIIYWNLEARVAHLFFK